jgi:flagellar basal-body rod protein FlgG
MINGIMHLASENGTMQFRVLDQVTQNIANFNTTGYKAARFEQFLQPDGRVQGLDRRDMSEGQALITRRELDVAIDGHGYIPVTQEDGLVAYTRDGSMKVGPNGYLYTARGDLVGEGIKMPLEYQHVEIKKDGTVEVLIKHGSKPQVMGKLPLVTFINPEGLENIGGNKVVATKTSGAPNWFTEGRFDQGKLERSNVSVHGQIDQVLRLNAGLIANFKMIKFADDIYRQAVTLRQ